jgi:phosphatidylserine decarboxylase
MYYKIYNKQGRPIQQPQTNLVLLGIDTQRIPRVGSGLARTITKYCNRYRTPEQSQQRIQSFANAYRIHPGTIERCQQLSSKECWTQFESLNDFFIRRRVGLPNVSRTRKEFVSPVDAYTVFVTQPKFWVKGSKYSTSELMLGKNIKPLELCLFIFRLAPHHYHRVHCPVYGIIIRISTFGYNYNSVDTRLIHSKKNILTRNVRVVLEIQTPYYGKVYMAIIGATCVGSIVLSHPDILQKIGINRPITDKDISVHPLQFSADNAPKIRVNEELGFFQYGGSCVVVGLTPHQNIYLTPLGEMIQEHTLEYAETDIQVGDPLLKSQ